MPTTAEIKLLDHLKIVAYASTVPTLAFWICILAKMLILKDRNSLMILIVISILMILSQTAFVVYQQLEYTYSLRLYNGDLSNPEVANQIL